MCLKSSKIIPPSVTACFLGLCPGTTNCSYCPIFLLDEQKGKNIARSIGIVMGPNAAHNSEIMTLYYNENTLDN